MEAAMAKFWQPALHRKKADSDATAISTLRKLIDGVFDDIELNDAQLGNAVDLRSNISETTDNVTITTELPGVQGDDIEVLVVDDSITLKGEKKSEKDVHDDKDRVYHEVERAFGLYERTIRLPFSIDPDSVKAEFKNGLLTVVIPKPDEAKSRPRSVEIVKSD